MDDKKVICNALLESMDAFHEFCEKHGLQYYLLGGTLLGAIRHKGFIPWDDDIDVGMRVNDYEKLIKLKNDLPPPFSIRTICTDKTYVYPYAKFTNDNLIIEEPMYIPFRSGIWIDVFPLDFTFDNKFLCKFHFNITAFFRYLFKIKKGSYWTFKYGKLINLLLSKFHFLFSFIPLPIFESLLLFARLPSKILRKPAYIVNFHGAWGIKEIAPRQVFQKRTLYDFEGRKYWGPEDADMWLSRVYGDYMTLPDESKRISHHRFNIIKISDALYNSE